jgi:hypothetical protein
VNPGDPFLKASTELQRWPLSKNNDFSSSHAPHCLALPFVQGKGLVNPRNYVFTSRSYVNAEGLQTRRTKTAMKILYTVRIFDLQICVFGLSVRTCRTYGMFKWEAETQKV